MRHSNASTRARAARLALHHYFDLEPLCARFALVPAHTFERSPELRSLWDGAAFVRPKRGRAFPGGWRRDDQGRAVGSAFGGPLCSPRDAINQLVACPQVAHETRQALELFLRLGDEVRFIRRTAPRAHS